MFSAWAAFSAFDRSRDAIPLISHHGLLCIAGITFFSAMFAVLKIPQRTLPIMFQPPQITQIIRVICGSKGIKDGADLESLLELLQRQRNTRTELYCHPSSRREV